MNQKHNFNFSQPTSLDAKALWLSITKALWQIGKGLLPLLVVMGINKSFDSEKWWVYLIPVTLLVVGIARAIINFKFFTFYIKDNELILQQGWLNKEQTVVKFDKIHEVNLNQKFLHKILGLYNVGIDTAGSANTEIEINGVNFRKALALKDVLTQRELSDENIVLNDTKVDEENNSYVRNNKISIGFTSLFKIGLTRNYLQTFGLLIAFSYQIVDQLESVFYEKEESIYDDIYSKTSEFQIGFLWIGLILGLILFVVLFNLLRTLLTYYNYQIQLKNKQLSVSFGLTDSHIISVPSNKVQLFQFQQNYFQRLMNLFEVKIKQVESNEGNKKKKGLIVPGANYHELNALFGVIYSKSLDIKSNSIQPHIRLLVIRLLIWSIIFMFLCAGVMYQKEYEILAYVLVVYCIIIVLSYLGYRNRKLFIEDDFIVVKQGIWDVTTTYLHISKVQQITLSQSLFQRKKQLGSVTLSTAGGNISLNYYHFPTLQKVANTWMYEIEKNKYKWT